MLKSCILVGLGGMIGSVLRFLFTILIGPSRFPYATLAVNIIGCFVIGWVVGWSMKNGDAMAGRRLFLATGICGGFTTFSAFSLECIQLLQQHRYAPVIIYVAASIVLGLAATFAGLQLTKL